MSATVFQIVGEALTGWLFADLVSGVFHWWEDRIARENTPIIGKWLIVPNRLHHRHPLAFTRGSILDRSLAIFVAAAIVSGAWLLLFGPSVFWIAFTLGGAITNEVHRWAHLPRPGSFVAVLQETGLLQSPRQHAMHHRGEFNQRYCVLTNWLNPALDALRFWARLETVLERCGLVRSFAVLGAD